jgi:hypothetical protein
MTRLDHWLTNDFDGEDWAARAEAIDEKVADLLADPDAVAEADEAYAGTLDYDGLETALADLHARQERGEELAGSDALAALLRMGKQAYELRVAKLEEMAEKAVDEAAAFRPGVDA